MDIDSFEFRSENFDIRVDIETGKLNITTRNCIMKHIVIDFDEITRIIEFGKRTYEALEKM